jgi:hypothetical protein
VENIDGGGEYRPHADEDEHPQTNGICERFREREDAGGVTTIGHRR